MVKFIPAVAYHFCLALHAAFTQPGDHFLAERCRLRILGTDAPAVFAASPFRDATRAEYLAILCKCGVPLPLSSVCRQSMKVLRGAMKLEDRTEVWGKLPLLLPFQELDSYLLFMGSKVLNLVPTVSALNIQGQPEDRCKFGLQFCHTSSLRTGQY